MARAADFTPASEIFADEFTTFAMDYFESIALFFKQLHGMGLVAHSTENRR